MIGNGNFIVFNKYGHYMRDDSKRPFAEKLEEALHIESAKKAIQMMEMRFCKEERIIMGIGVSQIK